MKNLTILFLFILGFNVSPIFSQGILAGQISPNMTYYDFPDDTLQVDPAGHLLSNSDSILLDINQDGIFDIRFNCGKSSSLGGSTNSGLLKIINQQGSIYTKIDSFLYFNQWFTSRGAKPFNINDSIIGNNFSGYEYLWSANSSNHGPTTYFHLWDTIGESYIGFNLNINNQLYYGWIRGEIQDNRIDAFIIKDLAFQQFPVGIIEMRDNDFTIYPNPVNNELYISGIEYVSSIQILDITGKNILEKSVQNNKVDLSHLTSGVYFIKIQNGNFTEIKKIIKK
jgi:hypothetical protein